MAVNAMMTSCPGLPTWVNSFRWTTSISKITRLFSGILCVFISWIRDIICELIVWAIRFSVSSLFLSILRANTDKAALVCTSSLLAVSNLILWRKSSCCFFFRFSALLSSVPVRSFTRRSSSALIFSSDSSRRLCRLMSRMICSTLACPFQIVLEAVISAGTCSPSFLIIRVS